MTETQHPETNPPMESWIEQAVEAFTHQNYRQAEYCLRQAIECDPQALEPRYHLANLCRLNGRFDEAVSALEPIRHHPRIQSEYLWFQFKAAWHRNDTAAAWQSVRQFRKTYPLPDDYAKEMLDFARQNGYLILYIQLVRKAGNFDDRRDLKWLVLASLLLRWIPSSLWRNGIQKNVDALRQKGRWRRVQVLLAAARFADRDFIPWIKQMGQIYRLTRDVYDPKFLREKVCHEKVLQFDPTDRESLDGLLLTLNDMGSWQELQERFESIPGENLTSWHRILQATGSTNLGFYDRAEAQYRDLDNTAQSVHARFCRGLIALECGRWQEALDRFQGQTEQSHYRFLNDFFSQITRYCQANGTDSPIDGLSILDTIPHSKRDMPDEFVISAHDRCGLCSWSGERRKLWRDTRSGWIRVRCPHCSMISVSPIPDMKEILALYKQPRGQEKSLYLHARQEVEHLAQSGKSEIAQLPYYHLLTQWDGLFDWDRYEQSLGEGKRFLDIGCSAGKTVMLFRQCGWQAEGMDVDPDAVAFAQSQGLNVKQGTLDSLRDTLGTYHFITLVDVIEHLRDPAKLIGQIYDLLEPGGLFYLKTPCADSFPHRFLGDRWLESSEHLHFFSRSTLEKMLKQAGFHIIGFKQYMDETTPFLHSQLWKQNFFPQLLDHWILKSQSGDTILFLVRKSDKT